MHRFMPFCLNVSLRALVPKSKKTHQDKKKAKEMEETISFCVVRVKRKKSFFHPI
jgi:hypothetical protein